MTQFWEFFTFELKLRFKSIATYVYFLLWVTFSFLCVASESFGPVSNSNGKVLLNGPYAISMNDVGSCMFGTIIMAAIFGTSVLRDFQRDTVQILFTKPVSKGAYLGGRWLGSFVTTVFAFSGMMVGTFLGTFAPWADHARIGPNHLWWYLQPFFSLIVLQIFFLGSLFFTVAALTRKIFVVYLQGVAVFMAWIIGVTVYGSTRSLEHFWSGILDPLGNITLDNVARYWTVAEKNTLLLPWDLHSGYSPGVFVYNRLLWSGVGLLALLLLWKLFPMSAEALTAKSQSKRAARQRTAEHEEQKPVRSLVVTALPRVRQVFGTSTTWAQFLSMARLRLRTIFREIPFWAIVGLLIVFAINNGRFAGQVGGENVWPVTYLMLNAVEGSAQLFFYIVATLYAAELVWRERDNHFDGIHDALPMSETVDWLAKLTAIAAVELVLLTVTLLCGVLMQTIAGFHQYDFPMYFKELYLVTFPQLVGFAILAMFVQTIVSNKFIGHGIVIGIFVIVPILYNFGIENTLVLPGQTPVYMLSDMNGFGHFVPALATAILYWVSIFAALGVVSIAYTRRGSDISLKARTHLARMRAARLAPAFAVFALLAIASGGWFYYNSHVLNRYTTAKMRRHEQALYETNFRQYRGVPQLKVTAVDTRVDIDPYQRSVHAVGVFTLQNKTGQPIQEIHLTGDWDVDQNVRFDRPAQTTLTAPLNQYTIYRFATPVAPGDVVTMTADMRHVTRGFRDGNEPAQYAFNGTFFDNGIFPAIGYQDGNELADPRRRREEKLGPLHEMAERGDPVYGRQNHFTGQQADWITYHTVVSTSPDQIALSPGYLQREWQANGRRYFEYSMGSTHVQDFFNYISGRYQVKRDVYQGPNGPVNIEVYYDEHHPYDVDTMIASSKAGLAYDQQFFSPYQFTQYRVIEFPRYRGFAQSFPNTIPYSEAIGFINRVEKPTDVDLTYFVTAHELGHQWWGHQLIGGMVQGSNMMSETYAEYTAYQIMRRKYGDDYMHRVFRHFLDRYLRGRAGEIRHEPPLALVQREPYVWYEKGGQIMYTLADYVGEDKINLALKNFLMQYRYANANNQVDAAGHTTGIAAASQMYPDTRLLVAALREQTPPDLQYLIDDGFNRIVLYDNKALSAKWKKRTDGKYDVTLDVQARKTQADGNGVESPMALNDVIEVGVFTGKKDEEKTLSVRRERMTAEHATYSFVVDQQPTRAGIDPFNKLIDRISDDNMTDVAKE
ncbi:M1 family aminopeptidase [Terriglobus aquaticus]|uniref:M1 family aminopeptidase n=1 Tax=Terriglobus aquaticus TaxID=940139 RepID=A0ABW9KJN0_9BACT|nr:M1 family aminopeptidase [Terriglobus aquaticus]